MFWIFLAVFWVCETYLYTQGHNTFLFAHKTKAEKHIRDNKAGIVKENKCNS